MTALEKALKLADLYKHIAEINHDTVVQQQEEHKVEVGRLNKDLFKALSVIEQATIAAQCTLPAQQAQQILGILTQEIPLS